MTTTMNDPERTLRVLVSIIKGITEEIKRKSPLETSNKEYRDGQKDAWSHSIVLIKHAINAEIDILAGADNERAK